MAKKKKIDEIGVEEMATTDDSLDREPITEEDLLDPLETEEKLSEGNEKCEESVDMEWTDGNKRESEELTEAEEPRVDDNTTPATDFDTTNPLSELEDEFPNAVLLDDEPYTDKEVYLDEEKTVEQETDDAFWKDESETSENPLAITTTQSEKALSIPEENHISGASEKNASNHTRGKTINLSENGQALENEEMTQTLLELRGSKSGGRPLRGIVIGITKVGSLRFVVQAHYKGYNVYIPLEEMFTKEPKAKDGEQLRERERLQLLVRTVNRMMAAEIEFIVTEIHPAEKLAIASRKRAMLQKQKRFYFPSPAGDPPRITEGTVVEARITSVGRNYAWLEVFGVDTTIGAVDLSWQWIHDCRDHFSVGERVKVLLKKIRQTGQQIESLWVSLRELHHDASVEAFEKCIPQSFYIGTVTGMGKGHLYVNLHNGALGVAHTVLGSSFPALGDTVSFICSGKNEETKKVVGLISRVINNGGL